MFHYRKLVPVLGALAAIAFSLPAHAYAASGSTPSQTAVNSEDLLYDFEVYIAEDITVYRVIVDLGDGTFANYVFDTLEDAEAFVASLMTVNVYETEIVEENIQGPWEYLTTYDKRSTAEAVATYAEALGFYAKVKRVSIFSYRIR